MSSQKTADIEQRKISRRRLTAEASLLAMMAENARIYNEFGPLYTEESFLADIHKKIFSLVRLYYNENTIGKCSDFLASRMQGKEKELSGVLMSVQNIDNPHMAAKDFSHVLDDEIFNEKLQKAQNEGNIEAISELLKEKKTKRW